MRRDALRLVSADELPRLRRGRRARRWRPSPASYELDALGPGSERPSSSPPRCGPSTIGRPATSRAGSGMRRPQLGTLGPMAPSDADAPAPRRGRAAGRPVHPRPAEHAEQRQAARRRHRRHARWSGRSSSCGPTSCSSTRCSRAGSRACSSSSSSAQSGLGRPGHRADRAPEPGRGRSGARHPRRALDAVLGLRPDDPDQRRSRRTTSSRRRIGTSRVVSVFAPKGGVGKTTIAFNLAVALGQLRAAHRPDRRQPPVRRPAGAAQGAGRRAVDPRPADRPDRRDRTSRTCCGATRRASTSCSRRRGSRWPRWSRRATSTRCCRCCAASTGRSSIDMPAVAHRHQPRVPRRERHDPRDRHLRLDDDPQHDRRGRHVPDHRLPGVEGPLPREPRRLARRHRSRRPRAGARSRPRAPRRVGRAARRPEQQRGRAVRARQPARRRSAWTSMRIASELLGRGTARQRRSRAGASGGPVSDPRPIGVFDSGVGGLTVLREIVRRLPRESTIYLGDNARAPYGTRPDEEVAAFSPRVARRARRTATSRRSSSPATPPRRSRSPTSAAATTCRSWASIRPGAAAAALATRNRRVGVIATPATVRSHAYFQRDQGREPGGRGVRARDAGASCRWSKPGELSGAEVEADVSRGAGAAARRARRGRRVRLPAAGLGADRHAAARLHALPAAAAGHRGGRRRAGRDRRLGHGDGVRAGGAADGQRPRGPRGRRASRAPMPTVQLTTGDVDAFRAVARAAVRGRSSRTSSRVELHGGRVVTRTTSSRPRGDPGADDRLWQAGFLVGSALGAAATLLGRRAERSARRASSTGRRPSGSRSTRLRSRARHPDRRPSSRPTEAAYAAAMARIVPRLSEALGTELPGVVERAGRRRSGRLGQRQRHDLRVADRHARGRAARPGRAAGRRPRQGHDGPRQPLRDDPPARASCSGSWARRCSASTTSRCSRPRRRPAGCCSSRRTSARRRGRSTSRSDPFRTWIALHETTHAFEFEAHPWLRPYLADATRAPARGCSREDASSLGREALGARSGDSAARRRRTAEHWIERLMSDEQRRLLPRDAGGHEPARGVQRLRHGRGRPGSRARRRADQRPLPRASPRRRSPFERAILRLTGMDLKLEQYRKGERFVRTIAEAGGPAALRRLWDGPEIAAPPRRDRRAVELDRAGHVGRPRASAGEPAEPAATAGPGSGPGGVPAAIALTPILSARYRAATSSGSARRRPARAS